MKLFVRSALSVAITIMCTGISAQATIYDSPSGADLVFENGDIINGRTNLLDSLTVNGAVTINTNTSSGYDSAMDISATGGNYNFGTGSEINYTGLGAGITVYGNGDGAIVTADKLTINSVAPTDTNFTNYSSIYIGVDDTKISLNESTINTTGKTVVYVDGKSNNLIDFGDNTVVNYNNVPGSTGNFAGNGGGLFSLSGTNNTITANAITVTQDMSSSNQYGLVSITGDSNTIDFGSESDLSNYSTTNSAIAVSGNNSSFSATDGTFNFNNPNNGSGNNVISVNGTSSKVTLTGKMTLTGGVSSSGQDSNITLDATSGSIYTGATSIADGGTIDLSMTDGTWNMQGDSTVSNLVFNDSTVNTQSALRSNDFSTLTTDTLKGSGLFNIRTDIVGQKGDLVVVNNMAEGNYKLNVTNQGSAETTGTETLTVVKTGTGSTAQFSLANNVELGGYQYNLRPTQASATNFELYSTGKPTSTAEAASSFLNIGYLTNYIENQTLLQRLGDLRNSEVAGVKSDGLWIKGFGGKLSAFSGGSMRGFDMSYTGTQLGIDKNIDIQNGRLLVGVMAGFTRTNPNYKEGDGTGKNYTAGLYATYLNDNGIYVDNVIKYNSMHNQFNVKDTAGNSVKGTGKTQGIMLSTELGKRFWLSNNKQGLYIEPQAQLSYGYQNGDTVHASNGLKVGLSHYNSTLARVSGIVGYQIQGENPINVYVKTGVVREMSGGSSYRFNNGEKKGHTFRSSWFDNGIGANVTINKKHNIYAEADYATGGNFDNAMLNIGYRYSF